MPAGSSRWPTPAPWPPPEAHVVAHPVHLVMAEPTKGPHTGLCSHQALWNGLLATTDEGPALQEMLSSGATALECAHMCRAYVCLCA